MARKLLIKCNLVENVKSLGPIPGTTNGLAVTDIGDYALALLPQVTNVFIPHGITNIGSHAFYADNLGSVFIPGSVQSVGSRAFGQCGQLTGATFGPGVSRLGDELFYNCMNLSRVSLPDSVTSIGSGAFSFCSSLTNLTLGTGLTNLGDYAFQVSGLQTVYFTGNAPHAGLSVYFMSAVTNYYLPGTTNWGTSFGGRPAILWNPQFQVGNAAFGVRSNRFGFTITGTTNIPIVLEAGTNLANPVWVWLQTGTLTNGSIYYGDADWTNHPRRFYRIRSP